MQRPSTRRKFIATLGTAGTLSLAGCSSIIGGDGSSSPSDPTATATQGGTDSQSSSNTQTKNKNGENNNKKTTGKKGSNKKKSAPGKSVDDFEGDITSRWQIGYGKYKVNKQDAFQGSQSLVLQPKKKKKGAVAKISQSFYPETLDLSTHDLSLAVKVNKPAGLKIKAEILAPAESDMLTAVRKIPQELSGWVRFDIGYTSSNGNPNLKKVPQINIQIGSSGGNMKDFQVLIDDLRKIPKPKKGKVMFQFDDAHVSAYKQAFPILKQKGWPATVGVIRDAINSKNRLTGQMMREMGKANWDMAAHSSRLLPDLSKEQQRRELQKARQYLDLKGFKKGARHFITPYHRVNSKSLELIDEIYETGYLFGACPNNAQHPSNPSFISRIDGSSIRGAQRVIDTADKANQMVVIFYHGIGSGPKAVPVKNFKRVVDHVAKKDMDVITPSQLVDGKNW